MEGRTEGAAFDAARPISIRVNGAGGVRTVSVRWPTDEEWEARQRKRRVVIKQLGRGVSETTVPNAEETDAELLAKIRTDDGPELDAFEASVVIEELARAEVEDVTAEGDAWRIALRIVGGAVALALRAPTAREAMQYRRGFARLLDLPFGKQELRLNLTAVKDLFRSLLISADGYADGAAVPVIHQAIAVRAAVEAADSILHETHSPDF